MNSKSKALSEAGMESPSVAEVSSSTPLKGESREAESVRERKGLQTARPKVAEGAALKLTAEAS
jgi:hypothetical protein